MYVNSRTGQCSDKLSLSPQAEKELIMILNDESFCHKDRMAARNILIEKHFYIIGKSLGHIKNKCSGYLNFVNDEDFEEVGMEAIMSGIEKYDISRNVPLDKFLFKHTVFAMSRKLKSIMYHYTRYVEYSLQDSIDASHPEITHEDLLPDPKNCYEEIELQEWFDALTAHLSDFHRDVLWLKIMGYTNADITGILRKSNGGKYSTQRIQQISVLASNKIKEQFSLKMA